MERKKEIERETYGKKKIKQSEHGKGKRQRRRTRRKELIDKKKPFPIIFLLPRFADARWKKIDLVFNRYFFFHLQLKT